MGSAAGHKSVRCLTLSRDSRDVTSMKAISASLDDAAAPRQPCERSDGAHTGGPGGQMSWAELVARGRRRAAHPWRCSRGAASSRAGGALRIGMGAGSGGGLRASLRCQEPQPSCCLRSIAKRKTALKGQTSTGARRKRALGAGGWGAVLRRHQAGRRAADGPKGQSPGAAPAARGGQGGWLLAGRWGPSQ